MTDNDTLEEFRDAVNTQDTHKRLKVAEDLSTYLQDRSNTIGGGVIGQIADGLVPWIASSNFKVSCQGLELMGLIAERMGQSFKPHITGIISPVVDRLGDSKQVVRDQALNLIFKLISPVSSPQFVFDLLGQSFNHKNWRVREVLMICLTKTINRFTASSIQINKITPHIVKLLSDPTGQVRDTAVNTIVEIYRHVGERFRTDLTKKYSSDSKLNSILSKFDQVQKSGNMVATSQTDGAYVTPERKKSTKGTSVRRSTSFSAGDKKKNHAVLERGISSGAVDETDFMSAWEEVQEARIFSVRDFPHELDKINEILSNANADWEKRVEALRQLRSLIKISYQIDNFPKLIKDLEGALKVSVKDLRSTVVREACITLSYLSSTMENKFDYLAECMVQPLINLIPNSAKIMSTSGHAAIRLIIKHTASPRLIPVIVSSLLTSKSKDIRRRCAEYMGLLLEVWDTSVLKSHVTLLEEAIRKGISDADSEARAAVRRAYWHFADHYKTRADALMEKLDSSKQKLLQSDKNLINAGVSRPASSTGYGRIKSTSSKPSRTMSSSDAKSNKKSTRNGVMGPPAVPPMQRSSSQLDYKRVMPGMSPRQKSCDDMKRHTIRAQVREGRSRYAQRSATSQPSSRAGSPKRLMPTFSRERSEDYMKTYSPQKTRIPTPAKNSSRPSSRSSSRQTSRDPSPVRSQMPGQYEMRFRNGSSSAAGVTEDALWDALKRNKVHRRDRHNSQSSVNGPGSDESDTSSILSHDSNSKKNISQNYPEILSLLQQDSTNSKRDGLHSLLTYLHGMRSLSSDEAIRIKETFNRYFAEPNSKIYSLFLDVLSEFIVQCKNDLQDWLFILLTRLLQRLSTDILTSTQAKIARVLDVVRDSYPYDHQFQIITKYVTDNTQTPSLKMKVSLLQYLTGLVALMDASDFTNTALIRLAVSRIVTWISEPKSPDVRKEASAVIVALFQLNTPEFTMMLSNVPNSIQEGATRVIKLHLKQDSLQQQTPTNGTGYNREAGYYTAPNRRDQPEKPVYRNSSSVKQNTRSYMTREEYSPASYSSPAARIPSRHDLHDGPESGDLHSRIPVPHKLSFPNDDSASSPLYADRPPSHSSTPFSYATHVTQEDSPMWLSSFDKPRYETSLVSPGVSRVGDGAEQADIEEHSSSIDLVNQISTVLSGSSNSSDSEDIKSALLELLKMIRSGNKELIGHKLKSLLPVVLQLLRHKEATIRCLAARSLREVASSQPDSYRRDIKSFVLPLLETEADSQKEVSKTAEECCTMVSQTLPAVELLPVLATLVGTAQFPTNVSAIKMLNVVTEHCDSASMNFHLEAVVFNLLKAYDHEESSARKAAVFCLVAVHNLAGADSVIPFFRDLAGSKMKLLNLYIRRSQSSGV